jgi:hypothetical protein
MIRQGSARLRAAGPRDFLKAALAAPHVTLPVCVLLGVSLFAAGLLFVLRVAGVP